MQYSVFWDPSDTAPHLVGQIHKKNPCGEERGVFKSNAQNIQTSVLSKLLKQFQSILQNDKHFQGLFLDNPRIDPQIQDGKHLEKTNKLLYLSNCLTDFDEILHSHA